MLLVLVIYMLPSVSSTNTASSIRKYQPSLPRSWSNRLGLTLTPVSTGVWIAERPFVWNKIDVGGKSVICRMNDGSLLVHSPINHTVELDDAIKSLGGEVNYVVSPNYEHIKYARQYHDIYPRARMLGCPGIGSKVPDVNWTCELYSNVNLQLHDNGTFLDSIEYIHFDCESLLGKPFFNEVIFYHKRSKVLFMSDVFWNYPSSSMVNYCGISNTGLIHQCSKVPLSYEMTHEYTNDRDRLMHKVPFSTKLWKFGMDKVYRPFYQHVMIGHNNEKRKRFNEIVSHLLTLDVSCIAPCHGDLIYGSALCKQVLAKHFQ